MDTKAISRNLKRLMREQGLEDIDLCRAGGWTPDTVNKWLRAKGQPSAYAVKKLAFILGTTMEVIMEGVEDG